MFIWLLIDYYFMGRNDTSLSSFRSKTSLQRCKMTRQVVCPSEQSRAFSPKFPVLSQVNILLTNVGGNRKSLLKGCIVLIVPWGVSKNLWLVKMIHSMCFLNKVELCLKLVMVFRSYALPVIQNCFTMPSPFVYRLRLLERNKLINELDSPSAIWPMRCTQA